jgi:hypothetical protein
VPGPEVGTEQVREQPVSSEVIRRCLSPALLALGLMLHPEAVAAQPPRPSPQPLSHRYRVQLGSELVPILAGFEELAQKLDRDRDRVLSERELEATAGRLPGDLRVDLKDYLVGLRHELTGTPSSYLWGYPDSAQIEALLEQLRARHPERVSLLSLGETAEGRQVLAVRVSTAGEGERPHKVAVIAHQHAREWMSHQAALTTLRSLLEEPEQADLLDNFDFWFVPLANPDGYEYSRQAELMWRKNRSPGPRPGLMGVDLNRNFDADYRRPEDRPDQLDDDWGASDHPASLQYRGPHAASEPETRYLQRILDLPGLLGVVDLHGFGCKIVLPDELSDPSAYQTSAERMREALGPEFEIIHYRELYPITGHLGAYADQRGAVAITLEVGEAFQPHPDKIEPVAGLAARGVLAFARVLRELRALSG